MFIYNDNLFMLVDVEVLKFEGGIRRKKMIKFKK